MSRVLERLREMFKDSLLVRGGRIYERTARADRLLRELETVLPRLEAMVRGENLIRLEARNDSGGIDRPCFHDSAATACESDKRSGASHQARVSVWRTRAYEDVQQPESMPLSVQKKYLQLSRAK